MLSPFLLRRADAVPALRQQSGTASPAAAAKRAALSPLPCTPSPAVEVFDARHVVPSVNRHPLCNPRRPCRHEDQAKPERSPIKPQSAVPKTLEPLGEFLPFPAAAAKEKKKQRKGGKGGAPRQEEDPEPSQRRRRHCRCGSLASRLRPDRLPRCSSSARHGHDDPLPRLATASSLSSTSPPGERRL